MIFTDDLNHIARRGRLFAEHHADKAGMHPSLAGVCAIASAYILEMCHVRHYAAHIVMTCNPKSSSSHHCYPIVQGYMIDVTATQFSGWSDRRVIVQPLEALDHFDHWYWKDVLTIHSCVHDLVSFQTADNWIPDQIAFPERLSTGWRSPRCA